ncbi:MAG: phospholipase D-like domain-containing protein [Acidimicrobiales bacterium]
MRQAAEYRRALEGLLGVPASEGNQVDVLRNGDEIFPCMLDAICAAQRTIDLLTFIYWTGDIGERFAHALAERAQAGVRVRVLLDAVGARDIDETLVGEMTKAGCDLRWFRPVERGGLGEVNHRTHRKVLICDEQVSFTGGVGIADQWLGDARNENEWRDTHFRVVGPATDGLRAAFVDNWAETGGDIFDPAVDRFPDQTQDGATTIQVVRGAAETGWSDVSTLFRALVRLAERRIRIATAYFNPDDHLLELLADAADRGVEVQILLPGPHADKRFAQLASERAYGSLLEHGVQISCFQPAMLHAKVMTVDGEVANVGSANVNNRSTQYDEEVNLVLFDPAVVAELDAHYDEDLTRSEPVDPEDWTERSLAQRAAERATGLVRKLL